MKIRIIVEEVNEGDTLNLPADDGKHLEELQPHVVGKEYWIEGRSLEVLINSKEE